MKTEVVISDIAGLIERELFPKRIILFGSRAKKTGHKGSDMDIAIDCERKLSHREKRKLKEKIEEISGIYFVDLVFISELDEDFKSMILKTGKVLYEKK